MPQQEANLFTHGLRLGIQSQEDVSEQKNLFTSLTSERPQYQRFLGEEMKSELVIPLILETNVIGVLNLNVPYLPFIQLIMHYP